MKKLLFALFVSLMALSVANAADTPSGTISDGSKKMLEIIKKDNGKNAKQVRTQMESVAVQLFDFQRMTALAVGRGWRDATPAQQSALEQEFKNLLVRTYSGTMLRFKKATIYITPNPEITNNGREATVKSVVTPDDGKDTVAVDYMLYKGIHGWKIFNVSVEGASLVTVYRNQFNETISKSGVDGLIQVLKTKNAGGEH